MRPRFTNRGGFVHAYDPRKVSAYKKQINALARKQMAEKGIKPFDDAIEVEIVFYRPVQKSISRIEHERRVSGRALPSVKPDV